MKVALCYELFGLISVKNVLFTGFMYIIFLAYKGGATKTKIIWDGAFLEKNYSWC